MKKVYTALEWWGAVIWFSGIYIECQPEDILYSGEDIEKN